ncbi:MAG: molybdate ABC transporter substrate-binding protein [Bryobacteraceae bacterium]
MIRTFAGAALLAVLAAQTTPAQDAELRIICSNGFRAAFEKLLPQAEHASGRKAKVQFGASRNLKASIEGGEEFDLAILTPSQILQDLAKEGKIAAGTTVDLASTGIGVAARAGAVKPDVSSASAIKQTLLAAKSIGYVQVGAATPVVLEMLDHLGISQEIAKKTVYQPGAEQSMKSLADGSVDLALAPISEILPAPGVQLAGPLPAEFQKRVVLSAGIASATKNREAASKFIKALTTAQAAKEIKAAGMDPAVSH